MIWWWWIFAAAHAVVGGVLVTAWFPPRTLEAAVGFGVGIFLLLPLFLGLWESS